MCIRDSLKTNPFSGHVWRFPEKRWQTVCWNLATVLGKRFPKSAHKNLQKFRVMILQVRRLNLRSSELELPKFWNKNIPRIRDHPDPKMECPGNLGPGPKTHLIIHIVGSRPMFVICIVLACTCHCTVSVLAPAKQSVCVRAVCECGVLSVFLPL